MFPTLHAFQQVALPAPVKPNHSPITHWLTWLLQALIHESELDAWLAGQPSPDSSCSGPLLQPNQLSALHHNIPQQCPGTCLQQHSPGLRKLVLFSLNDYLGLSCHPDVCRAAAEAAQQVGLGVEFNTQIFANALAGELS